MLYLLYLIIGIIISIIAIFKSDEIIDSTSFVRFVIVYIVGIMIATAGGIGLGSLM